MTIPTQNPVIMIPTPWRQVTLAPIHRLPANLLSKIFLHLRQIWARRSYSRDADDKGAPWIVITRVCRHWQTIAHETPALWSKIYSDNNLPRIQYTSVMETWLRRSNPHPLTINTPLVSRMVQDVPSLKGAVHRIRRLRVTMGPNEAQSLLKVSMPLLEVLYFNLMVFGQTDAPKSLDGLFGDGTPRLRCLSIFNVGVNPNSFLFINLRILEMRNPTPQFSSLDFLSILRRLPGLESLQVSCVLEPPADEHATYTPIPPETNVVDLPCLLFLSIHGTCCVQDLDFLSHLSFPSTTILFFASGYPFHYQTPIAAVSHFLKAQTTARQHVTSFVPTKIEFQSNFGRLKLNIRDDEKVLVAFKLDSEEGEGGPRHQIPGGADTVEMLSYLQFPSVTTFMTNCYVHPPAWSIISSTFPAINRMELQGESARIFESIVSDYQSRDKSTPWIPIFPHLKALYLTKVPILDEYKEHFIGVLRKRHATSPVFALEKIVVDKCYHVTEEWAYLLSRVPGLIVRWYDWNPGASEEEENAEMEDMKRDYDETGEISLNMRQLDKRYDVEENISGEDDDV